MSDPDAPGAGTAVCGPVHLRPALLAAVAIDALPGTAFRWWIESALPTPAGGVPWAMAAVNLMGAFVLGALVEALAV